MAEQAAWAEELDVLSHGDATVRFSWLPSRLLQMLELLTELRRAGDVQVVFAGRVMGAGAVRLGGEQTALIAAVERLRASTDVGNVVLLRGSRELKQRVDVWGPGRPSDRIARAVKHSLDLAGILNADRGPI